MEDVGCAAACAPPTMVVYRLGAPYGDVSCEGEYRGGALDCMLHAMDGGAVYSSGVCVE